MNSNTQCLLPELLKNAVDRMSYHVMVTDREGVIVYVNPAFEQTTGYSSEEVAGKNPRILKSGEQPLEYYKSLWRSILEGKEFSAVIKNRKKNGDMYYALQRVSPIKDALGNVTHLVSTWEDVTERTNAQRKFELTVEELTRQVHALERSNLAIEILYRDVERKDKEIAGLKEQLRKSS